MSMNSELRARFGRRGPLPAAVPARSQSNETCAVLLLREGPLDRPIDVLQRLRDCGLSLKAAHGLLGRLAEYGSAVSQVPVDNDLTALACDLKAMNVSVHRRRLIGQPAAFITALRARHALSQRELADALGLDARTLQNWEQGRNQPDAATLTLMLLFDRSPELVKQAVFDLAEQPAA